LKTKGKTFDKVVSHLSWLVLGAERQNALGPARIVVCSSDASEPLGDSILRDLLRVRAIGIIWAGVQAHRVVMHVQGLNPSTEKHLQEVQACYSTSDQLDYGVN
jgi:hypothetical protein